MVQVQPRIANKIQYTRFFTNFPNFGFGTLLVAIFCAFLIVTATFTPIPLRILTIPEEALANTVEFFATLSSFDQITRVLNYIPQIPVIIMIAAMLGPRTSMIPVFLYVIVGLAGVPVFASGGGWDYLLRIRFGYIVGFFAGAFVTGSILSRKINKKFILLAAVLGVLAVHIIGTVYLTGVLLLNRESIYAIFGWTLQLSGMQIFYDLVFSIVAAFIGRGLRYLTWVATD